MTEITKEQLAVIEAATAWNKRYQAGDIGADAYTTTRRLLSEAVDALPDPYVPLVSDDEAEVTWMGPFGLGPNHRAAGALYLRKAADRLEGGVYEVIPTLREWAKAEMAIGS